MSNPYQLVVFDWEGTISDSCGHILHAIAQEIEQQGLGKVDCQCLRQYIEHGLNTAIKKCFANLNSEEHAALIKAVEKALIQEATEIYLAPDVFEFIQRLEEANVSLAIATNKGHYSLQRALQATGLERFFKVSRCASQVPAKPCPQMLEEIMATFDIQPSKTLMIGDSIVDMELAKNSGVDAIAVDFYQQQAQALKEAGAIAVFNDYKQLANFLGLSIG